MDTDYELGPFYVTFPANQTSVSFNVSLNDDNEVEKNETFRLEILDPILPNGVKLLDHSCEVTIVDTTSKSIISTYIYSMYACNTVVEYIQFFVVHL